MAERIGRTSVREQDPKVRAHNFEEVCYGFNVEEARREAEALAPISIDDVDDDDDPSETESEHIL